MYVKDIPTYPPADFADNIPVLYAPLKPYVTHVAPLMLEHIWLLKQNNRTTFFEELMYSGWICRLITLDKRVLDFNQQNEIIGWPEIRDKLIYYLDQCEDNKEIPTMLKNCMSVIDPILRTRFKENYHFPKRDFHCWWYTIHEDDIYLALHLVNAYQPQSPFDNLPHFIITMLTAVEHAVSIYPNIKKVSCGSWLNNVERFQNLWPASFKQNQKILNVTGGFGPGVWGQYMTTDGGFNQSKAAILRATGEHPFPLNEAESNIDEVIEHLKKACAAANSIKGNE